MSHAIPFAIKGGGPSGNVGTIHAAPSQVVPLAPPVSTGFSSPPTIKVKVLGPKPTYARAARAEWSLRECQLAEHSYRIAGLSAAYNAVPHRTKPAVRGRLQRAGLVPKRNAAAKLTH